MSGALTVVGVNYLIYNDKKKKNLIKAYQNQ